ncbi:hypothetical protein CLCR_02563 [Cladophialophora carrionii]|uniref:Major facilitator superfamily (MFS) profile domain-containing protein n=1 Tax=Cladophialophora carrionii TaxID=86049 RepID=A0A1C1CED8_9EURO|nr:hypothetical protein CLCR_02563 [Cladophialophora carrionii]
MGKVAVFTALYLAIGGLLFGYDTGIITSVIAMPTFDAYFGDPSTTVVGGIVSAFLGGSIAGTLFNMVFADMLGRKRVVLIAALIAVLGCALQAGAVKVAMLIVGRFVAGIGVGMLTATVPLYASELSEPSWRGTLSGLLQWMISWGFLIAQWLGYGCSHSTSAFSWRFPLAFQLVPALVLVSGTAFLNESPRWLVEKDRLDEARVILAKLRGNQNEEAVNMELQQISDTLEADRAARVSWKSIITKPSWRKRLLLGCGVQTFASLSGVNVIN